MPGTLRLILNLFDDLLDNFFFIFSLFKFKQVHSKSFKFRSSHKGSKTVTKSQKSSNIQRAVKYHYRFVFFDHLPKKINIISLRKFQKSLAPVNSVTSMLMTHVTCGMLKTKCVGDKCEMLVTLKISST